MSDSKNTRAKINSIKRVVILALLALVATNLFCYNTGDYRTKWGGNFEDISLWECYNGSGWINATQLPSSPFANTIYISAQNIAMHTSMIIEGGLVITGTLQLYSGIEVTINKDANCEIGAIQIYSASKLINNGEVKTGNSNSSIVVMDGGTFENNGLISASNASQNCQVTVNSNGKITFGSQGSITGNCSFTAKYGSTIATSNPDGFYSTGNKGSVQVGTRTYNSKGKYIFNGTVHQQTGNFNSTPTSYTVNDIIFDNPAGITLTNPITVVSNMELLEGDINYESQPQRVDGFYSPDVKKTVIPKNGTLMYNFLADLQPFQNNGEFVTLKWFLKGNFNGAKKVTFYWDENEDDNCNWNIHNFPKVYLSNSDKPLNTIWNPAHPEEISFIAHNFSNAKENLYYFMGKERDDTLLVIIISFIATHSGVSTVKITWATQSEINIRGYYIYRSTQADLNTAINLNYLIPATNSSQLQIYTYTDQVPANNIYYYWLEVVDWDGYNSFYGPAIVEVDDNGNQTPPLSVKAGFYSFSPNPFDSRTKIFYGIPSRSHVLMQVYNIKGQYVRTLVNEIKDSGNFDLFWDGRDENGNLLANGNYILHLVASGNSWTKKITILH